MRKLLIIVASFLFLLSCTDSSDSKNNNRKQNNVSEENKNVDTLSVTENQNGETEEPKVLDLGELMKEAQVYNPTNDEDYSDFEKTSTGLLYKFHRQGNEGELLTENDAVEVEMNYYLNKRLLFTTSSYPKNFKIPIEESKFDGDFYEGLKMMRVGDSASFVVPAAQTFSLMMKQTPPQPLRDGDVIRFDIGILSKENRVDFNKRVYERMKSLSEESRNEFMVYVHDNNITQQPLASGLIVIPILDGYGEPARTGDVVTVHYTATQLDGTVYKSTRTNNTPVVWTVGDLETDIPRGIDEALLRMREGSVMRFLVPSHLAFGQVSFDGLPPFANLIYEIEMIDIDRKTK